MFDEHAKVVQMIKGFYEKNYKCLKYLH